MAILSATKATKVTLQKRRNLFGLGITSLIAACSTDGADNDVAAKYVKPPPGDDVGTIPLTNLMASASEELTTTPANNAGITATATLVTEGTDSAPTRRGNGPSINDIGILIDLSENSVLGGSSDNTVSFHIENGNHESEGNRNKAKFASASLYEIAGAGKYDLVVSSPDFGNVAGDVLTGGVYIYWDMASNVAGAIAVTNHLEVKGLAGNDAIAQDAPAFFQLGSSSSAQYDMVVRSNVDAGTGAIYILWDVTAYAGADKDAAPVTVDFATPASATHGLLAIKGASAGDNIGANLPDILKINNNNDYDMIIKSATDMYVLWDFTNYYSTTAPAEISLTNLSATNGLLTISGAGGFLVDILKINNNDDYDMIIKSDTDMYILWDVANYYSTTTPTDHVDISLTDVSATNGLLTISGAGAFSILQETPNGGFLDVNDIDNGDNNINDLVFTDGGNTFILFGEQLAYRDVDGKAVSDTVDMATIKDLDFGSTDAGFFTYDKVVTPTTKADLDGIVGYRFASVETDIVKVQADYVLLSNASFPPALSDTDADLAVWDIA